MMRQQCTSARYETQQIIAPSAQNILWQALRSLPVLLEMYHESVAGASVDAICMLQRKLLCISCYVQAKGSGHRDTAEKQHIHIEMQQLQNQLQDMKSKIGVMESEAKDSIQVLQRCSRPNKASFEVMLSVFEPACC